MTTEIAPAPAPLTLPEHLQQLRRGEAAYEERVAAATDAVNAARNVLFAIRLEREHACIPIPMPVSRFEDL